LASNFFNYELPKERIAQYPVSSSGSRDSSKLLHAQLSAGSLKIDDKNFSNLPSLLKKGDLLVLNNSKVLPWRFFFEISNTEVELLLLRLLEDSGEGLVFEALAKPMRKLESQRSCELKPGINLEVSGRTADGMRLLVKISAKNIQTQELLEQLSTIGNVPIPPYIRRGRSDESDRGNYQTVFANEPGSVAAPTAGLHFTAGLFERLQENGIEHTFVTLHVGPASFLPVRDADISKHLMQREEFVVSADSLKQIVAAKRAGRRVVAVGTTSVRTLESLDSTLVRAETLEEVKGASELFIQPGFKFKWIDALITNFHQPLTTHLLLVAAFIGEENTELIYQYALAGEYRFLSYGDAMFLEI